MMKSNRPGSDRLIRHSAILVSFVALFLGLLTPAARHLGAWWQINPSLVLLVLAPGLLGSLILVFERRSAVKYWVAHLILSLIAPALAIGHDWLVVESGLRLRTIPSLLGTLAVNVALIGTFAIYVAVMSPRRCPECSRLAMIPLRSLRRAVTRTPTTRWCASCGAKYWKTCDGEWRKERRRTWLDESRDALKTDDGNQQSRFDPDTRIVNPMLSRSRTKALAVLSEGAGSGNSSGKNESH